MQLTAKDCVGYIALTQSAPILGAYKKQKRKR